MLSLNSVPKIRHLLSIAMFFMVAVLYFQDAIFLRKRILYQKSNPFPNAYYEQSDIPPKRLIMILVDALREDFVLMDESLVPNTSLKPGPDSLYKNK